jgi:hypothetical protein
MRFRKSIPIALAAMMAAPLIAPATVYFVSQSGSGNGLTAGTPMSPAAVNSKSSPTFGSGDIIIEETGTLTTGLAFTTSNYTPGTFSLTISGAGSGASQSVMSTGTVDCISGTNIGNIAVENLQLTCTTPPLLTLSPTGATACVYFSNNSATTLSGFSVLNCQISGAFNGIDFVCASAATNRMQNITLSGNVINGPSEFGIYLEETNQGQTNTHFSGVSVIGNVVENISGDDNGTATANGNGIVLSDCDNVAPVLKYPAGQFGGSDWGALIELNYVYNCGFDSTGAAGPGGIYGDNSSLAMIGNVVDKQYASDNWANGEGMTNGNAGPYLALYNVILDAQGGGLIVGFNTGLAGGTSYVMDNLVVNCGGGYVSAATWKYSVTAGSTNASVGVGNGSWGNLMGDELSGSPPVELPNRVIVANNTLIGNPNLFATGIITLGGGWEIINNVIDNASWIALNITTTSAQAPGVVVGNLYNGVRPIYNTDTSTSYTLSQFQALTGTTYTGPGSVTETYGDLEKVGATTYGQSGSSAIGCPLTNASETIYPASPFAIFVNAYFAPPVGSALYGGGISASLINTLTGVNPPTSDLNNRTFNGDIGAIGSGAAFSNNSLIPPGGTPNPSVIGSIGGHVAPIPGL